MSHRPPSEDRDEEDSSQLHTKERRDKTETREEIESVEVEQEDKMRRIIVLEEREIPFVEEKPPNFSPNFRVRIHRTRSQEELGKEKE
jgi:hypothetical protein